ncbi:hypothetical protein PHLCEN_2v120 [Hermanssonia centrifuga]|uniref:Uncharacterized protein n=1 Tax=Hermanssonia centrifuga TaxID=98765 RepID=A0A2R6S6Z7_9APHY|nr:hypothetical protein PHLCEN_2v120 [Hermanssonia centrifuga]
MHAPTQAPVSQAAFIESLRESTALYDLPSADLEKLVAQVVREEGFVTLLKSLDSMWKVKTLLGPVS